MITTKKEAARKKSLGELGELIAIKALVDKEFDKIRNLNDNTRNEVFADLYCEKGGKKYVITVKTRNKNQANGKLNPSYNLPTNAYQKASIAENKYTDTAHWIAVQFDHNCFSVYFGSLEELNGSNAIPVNKCEKGIIGEIWEYKKRHYFDWDFYTNLINPI